MKYLMNYRKSVKFINIVLLYKIKYIDYIKDVDIIFLICCFCSI